MVVTQANFMLVSRKSNLVKTIYTYQLYIIELSTRDLNYSIYKV